MNLYWEVTNCKSKRKHLECGETKKIRLTLTKYMVYAGLITKVVQREEIFLTNVF